MNFKTISTPHKENAHFSLPLFGHEPRTSRSAQALGKRVESAAGPTEEQSGTIAEPPLRSLAQRRSDRKKKEQTAQALGIFSTYRGAFRRWPPPRPPPTPTQEARSEKPAKKHSRARTHHRVSVFFPSPIGSNSVVHNVLRVKISHILTHKKYHTTLSGSTACGWTAVKQHEAVPASPRFTPVHPTLGRRMRT